MDNCKMNMTINIEDARAILISWKEQLKDKVQPPSNYLAYKPAFELEYFTEAVIRRFMELAEATFILLDANKYLGSIVTVRSIQETTAVIWYLNEKCLYALAHNDLTQYTETMTRLMLGWKDDEGFPNAINVLNLIDKVDKQLSGYRKHYDKLSEFVHPNWHGTMGLFAKTGGKELKVEFGGYIRGKNELIELIETTLITSIGLVALVKNQNGDMINKLIDMCCKLNDKGELNKQIQTTWNTHQ